MTTDYLFKSERLGFRNWTTADIDTMTSINQNEEVMRFFPSTNTREQTAGFVRRMQEQYKEVGFCYFAVDRLDTQEMIGFIGLSRQTYEAKFTPCIDIGWRLAQHTWGLGFATEGAKACLQYAKKIGLKHIKSVAPAINKPSIHVMQKIGMTEEYTFQHSLLADYPNIQKCVLYYIDL